MHLVRGQTFQREVAILRGHLILYIEARNNHTHRTADSTIVMCGSRVGMVIQSVYSSMPAANEVAPSMMLGVVKPIDTALNMPDMLTSRRIESTDMCLRYCGITTGAKCKISKSQNVQNWVLKSFSRWQPCGSCRPRAKTCGGHTKKTQTHP
jgi:hypothetical protein